MPQAVGEDRVTSAAAKMVVRMWSGGGVKTLNLRPMQFQAIPPYRRFLISIEGSQADRAMSILVRTKLSD